MNISSKISGRIERIYVKEGDVVRKGQVVAQIERLSMELEIKKQTASLDAAKSSLKLAQERYDNACRNIEKSFKGIERQITQVRELKAGMDKMRKTYERKKILFDANPPGISLEEFETVKTSLISMEARYLMSKKALEISQVGFRDIDIRSKGKSVPTSKTTKFKVLVDINTRIEKAQVNVARSGVKSVQAELNNVRTLLRETRIISPINGVVATLNMSVGEQVRGGAAVNPTEALMVIVDINRVYAVMDIRESELKNIAVKMKFEFTVDAFQDQTFQGRIDIINPLVDGKTHTVTVKSLVQNTGLKPRPGMFMRGKIIIGHPEKVMVMPIKAVQPREGNNAWVFLIKENRVYRTEVETGRQFGDVIEI